MLTWAPPHDYDVVVLSNVLEHIAARVELLRRLLDAVHPKRFLIRVPSEERDWLVPLRKELGLPHFSDPTHETEYTVEQLRAELHEAGLEIAELEQRWGEIWAVGTAEAGAILGSMSAVAETQEPLRRRTRHRHRGRSAAGGRSTPASCGTTASSCIFLVWRDVKIRYKQTAVGCRVGRSPAAC